MPLSVQHFFDSATSTFSYVVDDGAGHCAVIDPVMGFDQKAGRTDPGPAEALAAHIAAKGLRVDWLLETHAHADHLSAAPWLQKRFGGLVGIGAGITQVQREFRGIFNATDLPTDGSQFGHLFADGETFSIGRLQAAALHVPGHTPADVAYRITDPAAGPDAVFVGDTLFMPDVGTARCDFPGGDARTLFQSVRRILALPAETLLYLCHDYPPAGRQAQCRTTVARQRASNIHVRDGIAAHDFVAMRTERDATLNLPALMLPAVQVNIRAGHMPPPRSERHGLPEDPVNLL